MSRFDGSPVPLTYSQALCEIAARISWPTEAHQADVVKALQIEHGDYVVPEAETKVLEIERLRAIAAEQDLAAANKAQDEELAALRERLGINPAAEPESDLVDA